jgi:hypothetical protein
MKNKKALISFFLSSMIVSNTFGTEPSQLGYWQRFKNWIIGTSSQNMNPISHEITIINKEIENFSREEKIKKLQQMRTENVPHGKNPDEVRLNAITIIINELLHDTHKETKS